MGTSHIYETAEARLIKFYVQVGYISSSIWRTNRPLRRHGQGHVTHFTAPLYASAVYAVVVYLFVRPSVCHKPALYQK